MAKESLECKKTQKKIDTFKELMVFLGKIIDRKMKQIGEENIK